MYETRVYAMEKSEQVKVYAIHNETWNNYKKERLLALWKDDSDKNYESDRELTDKKNQFLKGMDKTIRRNNTPRNVHKTISELMDDVPEPEILENVGKNKENYELTFKNEKK